MNMCLGEIVKTSNSPCLQEFNNHSCRPLSLSTSQRIGREYSCTSINFNKQPLPYKVVRSSGNVESKPNFTRNVGKELTLFVYISLSDIANLFCMNLHCEVYCIGPIYMSTVKTQSMLYQLENSIKIWLNVFILSFLYCRKISSTKSQ
jgi:hypothetical protein